MPSFPPQPSPDNLPSSPRRLLHAHAAASLHYDDLILPRAFVIDPATGDPVCPVPPGVFTAGHHLLYVPEEADDALQLLVQPVEINPDRDAAADRWRIYHGPEREARWARLEIQSARRGPDVFDGDDLRGPNPLALAEPRACSLLNQDLHALAELCRRRAGVAPADPRAVGVDPDGIDIRARFGIIRLETPLPTDPAALHAHLAQLLKGPAA